MLIGGFGGCVFICSEKGCSHVREIKPRCTVFLALVSLQMSSWNHLHTWNVLLTNHLYIWNVLLHSDVMLWCEESPMCPQPVTHCSPDRLFGTWNPGSPWNNGQENNNSKKLNLKNVFKTDQSCQNWWISGISELFHSRDPIDACQLDLRELESELKCE